MKKIIRASIIIAVITFSMTLFSCGKKGVSRLEVAKIQAAQEGKDIFLIFTGSDWCPWCIRLENEVFSAGLFQQEVSKYFVILVLDFPQDESLLSRREYKENKKLYREYGVPGLPTVILTGADGIEYARTGYREGGPEKYLEHLEELRKRKP